MLGRIKHVPVILGCEMGSKQAHRTQVHRAIAEHLKKDRELPAGPGSLDAVIRRVLGEMEDLGAVREERGAAFGQVQAAHVEFGEMGDKDRRHLPLALREELHLR